MRNQSGESLISILMASLILTIVMTCTLALAVINTKESTSYLNKADTISAARIALDKIGRNVRQARSIGDMYGVVPPPSKPVTSLDQYLHNGGATTNVNLVDSTQVPLAQLENGTAMLTSDSFPATGDPYYGTGGSQTGSFSAPSNWPATPWTLSATTLILQVPVFDQNGFPFAFQNTNQGASNPGNLEAMDTYVYQVVQDPSRAGQYMLQVACFPAMPRPANTASPPPQTPITLLTGIVGPVDANGNLCIFQYVDMATNSASSTVSGSSLLNVQGIVTTLEVLKADEGNKTAVVAFRNESYMRNNQMSTVIGAPAKS